MRKPAIRRVRRRLLAGGGGIALAVMLFVMPMAGRADVGLSSEYLKPLLVAARGGTPAGANLLRNPGFEEGLEAPEGWRTYPAPSPGLRFSRDDTRSHSGGRSARVECAGSGFGMWQQVVDVEPGRVYVFTAYVAFEGIAPGGACRLQLVFRKADDGIIEFVEFPSHTGRREFALDFPPELKVRAPAAAARVEVNLFLSGRGRAWFDDVFFGLAATGDVSGTVTCEGEPLESARVHVWGSPWGRSHEALTDSAGKYDLTGIPVAFPRYILMASKDGYRTLPAGDVDVTGGANTTVDFELVRGRDPDDLRVKFGTLVLQEFVPRARIPEGAVIPSDAKGYPEAIRPYLESDDYIQAEHPDVVALAKQLVGTLGPGDRTDVRKVAWVLYEWVSKHIDHDGVFSDRRSGLDPPYRDVTSGIWQTLDPDGWCWGKSFLDWCYRPDELLKVECGICVEHAWLVSAMLRSLNIPARASVGSLEFWAQDPNGNGAWVGMSTTGGRTGYRERGTLAPGRGFEGGRPHARFSVLSRPILHEDWNARNKGLWRERHPWTERYEGTKAGHDRAESDLTSFGATGEAPRMRPPGRARPRRGTRAPGDSHLIHYSDVTINLWNMGDQRTLDVRFPLVTDPPGGSVEVANVYWTNHPECVRRTWIEEITHPPVEGTERWFHIEFALTNLLDGIPSPAPESR